MVIYWKRLFSMCVNIFGHQWDYSDDRSIRVCKPPTSERAEWVTVDYFTYNGRAKNEEALFKIMEGKVYSRR